MVLDSPSIQATINYVILIFLFLILIIIRISELILIILLYYEVRKWYISIPLISYFYLDYTSICDLS